MPGVGDLLGILEIKEMRGRPRQAEAREMLERLRDQVHPICVAHKWKVQVLEEFLPAEAGLLGVNMNRGMKIRIRLRPSSDEGNFLPFESVLDTLLHELVHNEIGPHSAKFFKKWDELRAECEKLMREGITGRNMPFAGDGQSLGGGQAPADARAAALKAAEKRRRQQGIMTSGGQRLGGGGGPWGAGSGTAAQRAAAAAQRRDEISRGCGNRPAPAASGEAAAADGTQMAADWECSACTLINAAASSECEACGRRRLGVREKRPAPTAGPAAPGAAGLRKASGTVRSVNGGRGGGPLGVSDGSSGGGGGGGPSTLNTWTCFECPFRFPNGGERSTCETCGAARRTAAKPGSGSGSHRRSNSRNSGVGSGIAEAGQSWEREAPSWVCPRCTVVNVGMFLLCGTCDAERPSEGAEGGGGGGRRKRGDLGWTGAGHGDVSGGGFSAGGGPVAEGLGSPRVGGRPDSGG